MPPEIIEDNQVVSDFYETSVHPPNQRKRAALILGAVAVVAVIGIGFALFSDRAVAVADKAEEVAVEATTSVVNFARSLVEVPVTLDGGRIAAAYPLPQEGKAIVANLSEMKLYLFEDGVASTSYDILSRGRPGTAWETPPGSYAVKTKELEHYSTIGDVWMPFAMQFQGNFFIHGWPYYSSGAQVPEGYSGGCVRMGTDDMGEIYEFGEIGTPVIVLGGDATAENSTASGGYGLLPEAPKFPTLRAKSFVVGDLDTGDIFARRDDELVRPIASVAKLMTAAVDLELLNQYDETKISKQAVSTEESYGNLRAGETLAVSDLLYPLLLESSNDAAEALAEIAGRARFLGSMNDKAASIGLADTNFDDPAGLSAETKSTAADLFRLVQYIHRYKAFILKTSLVKEYAVGAHRWRNSSQLLNDEDYAGGKHGYIPAAGKTLVATFSLRLSEFDDRSVAVVLLDSSDPRGDAQAAKKYLNRWVSWTPAATPLVANTATSTAAI